MADARDRRWARGAYRLMLLALPASFRRDFGADMTRLFLERLAETDGRPAARLGLWVAALWDVAVHGARERATAAATTIRTTMREGMTMEGWLQDLRLATRALRRRPGFTTAAAGTLALGIGAVVALFSVVNGVLLRPLPYPDSDRLVVVWKVDTERGGRGNVDHPDVRAWQQAVPGFLVAGYSGSNPTLTGFGDPEVVPASRVTDGLMAVFGVEPLLGRDLTAEDDEPDGARVAVVSWGFWQERLGGRADALGASVTLNGEPWEVVGVAPAGFDEPDGTRIWLPRRHPPEGCAHGCNIMRAVGRLPAADAAPAVEARLAVVDGRLAEEFPDSHRDTATELQPMHDYLVADVEAAMWVLLAAVGMVLLIACANVANLVTVRSVGRTGELAVRAALGASRARLARQLLAEAAVLATLAAGAGLLLAAWGVRGLAALAPAGLPRMDEIGLDGTAVLFTVALAALVAALFGVLPARRAARTSLEGALRSGRRTERADGGSRSRGLLLAGEVALSLTLLLGAGLLFRTLQEMRSVDLGFQPEHVERFRLSTPGSRYDTEATVRFFHELEDRLEALPGVEAVGHGFGVPYASGSLTASVAFPNRPPVDPADQPGMGLRVASPGMLDALGMELRSGRWLEASDRREAPAVAVINEAAARTYWPEGDPVGDLIDMSVSWGWDEEPARTIVGVVADVRSDSPTLPDAPTAWVPSAQMGADVTYMTIRRTAGAPSVLPDARRLLRELDPLLAVTGAESLADAVAREGADTRFYLTLLSLFSVLALVLAAVGLYGVVAYAVSRRAREIGIRRALGARPHDVVGMVLKQGVGPALAGVVMGLLGAWFASRALASLLYGVQPYDLPTLTVVTGLLTAVVAVATIVPARRASRIAPSEALREE